VVLRRRDGRVDRHPETMKSSDPRRPGQIVVASSDPEPSRTLQDRLERRYSLDYEIEYGVTKQIPIAATIMSQQWSKSTTTTPTNPLMQNGAVDTPVYLASGRTIDRRPRRE
jgi:hypothetical protein